MTKTITKGVQLLLAIGIAGAVFPGASEAQALPLETGVQNNGFDCVPESSNAQAWLWVTNDGFKNVTASNMTVFCPLTEPSFDSWGANLDYLRLEIHYFESPPTNCKVVYRSQTGSLTYSATMVAGTTSVGTPVIKLSTSFVIQSASSAGYQCSLPSMSTILGSIGKKRLADITGGI